MPEQPIGLVLSDDLLFSSRITGTAGALGLSVRTVRTSAELIRQADLVRPTCVLLDLHNPGLDVLDVVAQLKSIDPPPLLVAYGSHVEAATLHKARQAGCDRVLPRSQFVEELVQALPAWINR